jgi:hypothetical protein
MMKKNVLLLMVLAGTLTVQAKPHLYTDNSGEVYTGDGDTFAGNTYTGDTFAGDTYTGDTYTGNTFAGDTFAGDGEVYTFLTFEMTDGSKASVSTTSLTLTINGNMLTVGSQTFTLTNLSKMYFSTTDESTTDESATGIEEFTSLDEATEIYDLQGHQIQKEQMRKGVYIIKTKKKTSKIIVK